MINSLSIQIRSSFNFIYLSLILNQVNTCTLIGINLFLLVRLSPKINVSISIILIVEYNNLFSWHQDPIYMCFLVVKDCKSSCNSFLIKSTKGVDAPCRKRKIRTYHARSIWFQQKLKPLGKHIFKDKSPYFTKKIEVNSW